MNIINSSGRTRTDRTDPDGPGRTRTDPDGRTDGRTGGRAGGRTGPIGICTKFKTGGVTSNLSEIHTVDDLLCSSDPNLIVRLRLGACSDRLHQLAVIGSHSSARSYWLARSHLAVISSQSLARNHRVAVHQLAVIWSHSVGSQSHWLAIQARCHRRMDQLAVISQSSARSHQLAVISSQSSALSHSLAVLSSQ